MCRRDSVRMPAPADFPVADARFCGTLIACVATVLAGLGEWAWFAFFAPGFLLLAGYLMHQGDDGE